MKKLEDLEAKIALRAKANVQAKINTFKKSIDAALVALCGSGYHSGEVFGAYEHGKVVDKERYPTYVAKIRALELAIKDHRVEGGRTVKLQWPRILWDAEEEAIRNELLSKMDLMQQILMAKPGSGDDVTFDGDEGE